MTLPKDTATLFIAFYPLGVIIFYCSILALIAPHIEAFFSFFLSTLGSLVKLCRKVELKLAQYFIIKRFTSLMLPKTKRVVVSHVMVYCGKLNRLLEPNPSFRGI